MNTRAEAGGRSRRARRSPTSTPAGGRHTNYPSRRARKASEVAAAVVFLASDEASDIHGVILPVDGGALTR